MELKEFLQDLTYIVITVVIPIIGRYAAGLIKSVKVSEDIRAIENIILDAVIETNQTYVKSLKESGSFSNEAQATAKAMAMETVAALVSDKLKGVVESLYGCFESYVSTKIEVYVNTLKS